MIILRRQCRSQLFVEFGAFYRTGLQHNSPLLICSAASSCRVKGELGSIPPIIAAGSTNLHHQAVVIGPSKFRRRSTRFAPPPHLAGRSEEHTSELQSLMRISYAV